MDTASYREFTGTAAENYERCFVPVIAEPVSRPLLEAASLQPGEAVIDVACGTGVIARAAARTVGAKGTVSGLDLAPDMIDVARAITATGAAIDWHTGDAASLPFPDDSFDVALCQMALMFMDDRGAAAREMRRVVRPGGRVAVSTPGAIQAVFAIMEEAIGEHIDPELGAFLNVVFSMHDPTVVTGLLRDAGCTGVSSFTTVVPFRLPPPAEFLWQYISLTPIGPLVIAAPDGARAAMERDVVRRWQPFVVDGHTTVDQPMVIATGRR